MVHLAAARVVYSLLYLWTASGGQPPRRVQLTARRLRCTAQHEHSYSGRPGNTDFTDGGNMRVCRGSASPTPLKETRNARRESCASFLGALSPSVSRLF